MSSNSDYFLKKALGEDFLQSLEKFELWKPGTRTTVDHEEIKTALKIVPRTIMSLLIAELAPMQIGETKEISLPINQNGPADGLLKITKHERDVYSGEVHQNNKIVVDFKYRSLPGVGLVIMSAFELYDMEDLEKESEHAIPEGMNSQIQRLIDERLAIHSLVNKVVDSKIAERDAVQQLILAKITHSIESKPNVTPLTDNTQEAKKNKKISPLKDFLKGRKEKLKKNEYLVQMSKGEHVHCPDCGKDIYDSEVFSGCICFGDDMDKKVYMTKCEDGLKVRFGRGWDPENIEMLLEVLRSKRG